MNKNQKFVIAFLFTIIGVVVCIILFSYIFPFVPNENKRYFYIKKFLKKNQQKIETIFLGNSVVQNGIDAKYYSDIMKNENIALNLATSGQSFYEGLVLLDSITPTPTQVIWCLRGIDLHVDPKKIPKNRINSLYMNNYFPSKEVLGIMKENKENTTYHNYQKPFWQHYLNSRWVFQSAINFYSRRVLRKDLNLKKSSQDMFYPSPYTKKISLKALKFNLDRVYKQHKKFAVSKKRNFLFKKISEYLAKKNIKFYLVLAPEHPYVQTKRFSSFYADLNTYIKNTTISMKISVFDFSNILNKSHFIDHAHPSREGAKIFTKALALKMKKNN